MTAITITSISEALALFLMPLTVLAAIEKLFLDQPTRDRLACFIFGYTDVNVKDYEANVTTAALVPFLNTAKRVSYWRVLVLSPVSFFVSMQLLGVLLPFFSDTAEPVFVNPLDIAKQIITSTEVAFYFTLALLITSPFDYISIWITKKTFVDKRFGDHKVVSLFAIDNLLSALPCLFIFGSLYFFITQISAFAFSIDPFWGRAVILIAGLLLVASASLFAVAILQIALLISGMVIRAVFRVLKFNQPIGLTPASDQPLSFIGFVFGLVFVAIYLF